MNGTYTREVRKIVDKSLYASANVQLVGANGEASICGPAYVASQTVFLVATDCSAAMGTISSPCCTFGGLMAQVLAQWITQANR